MAKASRGGKRGNSNRGGIDGSSLPTIQAEPGLFEKTLSMRYRSEAEAMADAYASRESYIERLNRAEEMFDGAEKAAQNKETFQQYADEVGNLFKSLLTMDQRAIFNANFRRRQREIIRERYPLMDEWQRRTSAGETIPEYQEARKQGSRIQNDARRSMLREYAKANLRSSSLHFWTGEMRSNKVEYDRDRRH